MFRCFRFFLWHKAWMPFSTYVQVILMIYNSTMKLISLSTSLNSTGNPKLFPKVAVPIFTPTSEQDLILSDFFFFLIPKLVVVRLYFIGILSAFHWWLMRLSKHLCEMCTGFTNGTVLKIPVKFLFQSCFACFLLGYFRGFFSVFFSKGWKVAFYGHVF